METQDAEMYRPMELEILYDNKLDTYWLDNTNIYA